MVDERWKSEKSETIQTRWIILVKSQYNHILGSILHNLQATTTLSSFHSSIDAHFAIVRLRHQGDCIRSRTGALDTNDAAPFLYHTICLTIDLFTCFQDEQRLASLEAYF